MSAPSLAWHKVLELDTLPEGRVTTVCVGTQTCAVSNFQGTYGALANGLPPPRWSSRRGVH
ncbi:MAG: hypothetical protein J6386_15235 [Candidatus Synoicihabitans palmerolidicus]|nr:hypothetical protein [Candidatus Synoicihabitans palmerolidicus]